MKTSPDYNSQTETSIKSCVQFLEENEFIRYGLQNIFFDMLYVIEMILLKQLYRFYKVASYRRRSKGISLLPHSTGLGLSRVLAGE